MSFDHTKAPFPWPGGKSRAATAVWAALGDVDHYCEAFAGSLAVLLGRPHPANRAYHSETVCDADGLLTNAWRSIQYSPDATAEHCSWPVSELDLSARHIALVRWREQCDREMLAGTPEWHDPKMAGWWLWGVACWIGGGWCAGTGPWTTGPDGRIVKQSARRQGREPGVDAQRPHVSCDGQGVNHPGLREPGVGVPDWLADEVVPHAVCMPKLKAWFRLLSARLRHVRILSGDWKRAVTSGASLTLSVRMKGGVCGVFLDPPYADTAGRAEGLYAVDCLQVAHDVRAWALKHGGDKRYRIVVAGFEGEHGDAFTRAGWTEVEWFRRGYLTGGMANVGDDCEAGVGQQDRERLWCSPHCLGQQRGLFDTIAITEGEK